MGEEYKYSSLTTGEVFSIFPGRCPSHSALSPKKLRTSLFASELRADTLIFSMHPSGEVCLHSQPPAYGREKPGKL